MITTDFAPNEGWNDAMTSLITLVSPWSWRRGVALKKVSAMLGKIFPSSGIVLLMSGRAGIKIALQALRLPPDSEVVVQAFTCEAVVLPVFALGFKPFYADIESETYSVSFDSLVDRVTPKTKVIILQHTFGMVPSDRNKVLEYAKSHNIFVIEDLAHGFDPVFWQNEKLSDTQILTLSFGRSKALSSVFGCALITTNKSLEGRINQIEAKLPQASWWFMLKLLCYKPLAMIVKKTYSFAFIGKGLHKIWNRLGLIVAEISAKEREGRYDSYLEFKYPNCLAKLLTVQLDKYQKMQDHRNLVCELYASKIGRRLSTHKNVALSRFPLLIENRDAVVKNLARKNIFLGTWYTQAVAPRGLELSKVGYASGSCPVAEDVCQSIINLPTLVTFKQANKIIEMING